MGNTPPVFDIKTEKSKLEINCFKIKGHLEIKRDRKLNDARAKEKLLLKAITSPNRSRQDEIEKARIIIGALNYVKACEILIRDSEIIQSNSLNIIENHKDHTKIVDLLPFLETIIWSVKYMDIDNLMEFQEYILYLFGKEFLESVEKNHRVDPDLKKCFENVIPTPIEVNDFFVDFCYRYNLPIQKLNEIGHEFVGNENNNNQGGGGGGGICNNGQFNNNGYPNQFNYQNPNFINGNGNQQYDVNNNYGGGINNGGEHLPANNVGFNQTPVPNNVAGDNSAPKNEALPSLDDFEERLRKLKGN